MPNIQSLLKAEITRLSRREVRSQVGPIRKATATYRRDIARLKRQIAELERKLKAVASQKARSIGATEEPGKPVRFVAKGLRSLRTKLGLSQPDFAKLMGVSPQSIYNWESKRAVPRKEQVAAIVSLRSIGKREAQARLQELVGGKHKRK